VIRLTQHQRLMLAYLAGRRDAYPAADVRGWKSAVELCGGGCGATSSSAARTANSLADRGLVVRRLTPGGRLVYRADVVTVADGPQPSAPQQRRVETPR
jgi:hypothetical protein